jgi:predicted ATPase
VRGVIGSYGGREVDAQGDSFFVAFGEAIDAVRAAMALQRALAEHGRPEVATMRTRTAIHTGEPGLLDGGYVGLDVHRAARIVAVAHGGQVLVSAATATQVRNELSNGTSLRDLGSHRLKDLAQPEHIFQLVIPELSVDFPPLPTQGMEVSSLPVPATPFIGRRAEVANVRALIERPEVRLVTLTGPGGAGKTRLSMQVASEVFDAFADGVFYVDLAPIRAAELVLPAVARVLQLTADNRRPIQEQLQQYLRERELLLVLDNFEQIMSAAPLVAGLLQAPYAKVLITSREPLQVTGEHEFPVPALALPDLRRLLPVTALAQYEAVELFVRRAQAIQPDFQLTEANAAAVAEICMRADGLPLAIELAAARIKLLPPQALLARLRPGGTRRLSVLTGGPRDLPERQQTLRNAINWSFELLERHEQALLATLGVFVGGFTAEAVEAICFPEQPPPVPPLDLLKTLLHKSLIRREEGLPGEIRFGMLETIREFASEQLDALAEAAVIRQRHASYFLSGVARPDQTTMGPQQVMWLNRLEHEHGNLRAAIAYSVEQEPRLLLQAIDTLGRFWSAHGHLQEARRWLQIVAAKDGLAMRDRAKVLNWSALLARRQGDFAVAQECLEESLRLWQALGDREGSAMTLTSSGFLALNRGDPLRAAELFNRSLALIAKSDRRAVGSATIGLTEAALNQGDYARARELAAENLAQWRDVGDTWGVATALTNLGHALLGLEDFGQAARRLREGLQIWQELEDRSGISRCLEGLGGVIGITGQCARAAQLFGAAEVLRAGSGVPRPPSDQPIYERMVGQACAGLRPEERLRAWDEGRAMPAKQVIAYAMEDSVAVMHRGSDEV